MSIDITSTMSPHEFFQVIPLGHVVDFPQLLNSAYVTGRLATLPEPQVHLGHVDDVHSNSAANCTCQHSANCSKLHVHVLHKIDVVHKF